MKDSIWNRNQPKFIEECEKLCFLARRIVRGEESVIEGSREMMKYMVSMKEEKNPVWNIFRGVDTETDHLPFGTVRQYWNKESLEGKDDEIKKAEDFHRARVVEAARKIRSDYLAYLEEARGSSPEAGRFK